LSTHQVRVLVQRAETPIVGKWKNGEGKNAITLLNDNEEKQIYFRFPNVESYDQIGNERILNIISRIRLDNNE
jgi:23S rRNA-/tRNA-specific pseudouridylate synthase